jgi:hypothetical protein
MALVVVALLFAICTHAQQPCQAPALTPSKEPNIFNDALERELGELSAANIARRLRVIEDEAVTGDLRRIGARLAQHMATGGMQFRFFVVDSSEINAFAIPGGRIYVTRKMIGFVRNEDELASVLAHEMGHQLAHHSARDMTRWFRKLLKVTELKDAADLRDKYHQYLDNRARKPEALEQAVDQEQHGADQVGIYASALAGYSPKAAADLWDRFAGTKGKTGSWLTSIFGGASEDSIRLGQMLKNVKSLPAECIDTSQRPSPEQFRKWQAGVAGYTGFGKQEDLHNLVARKALSPALREEIGYLRFSPDGKYILAQDSASIYVLTREPFAPLFRINAYGAYPAQFTPDSQGLVFHDRELRVQRWNLGRQQLEDVSEIFGRKRCTPSALSPDGKYLPCVHYEERRDDVEVDLTVFDVATSETVYFRKQFMSWSTSDWTFIPLYLRIREFVAKETPLGKLAFSSDGRYLVASSGQTSLAVDLPAKKEVPLPSSIKNLLEHSFAFLSGNRLVGMAGSQGNKSAVMRFPSGETEASGLDIGGSAVSGPARGDYVILRPLNAAAAGLLNLRTKKIDVVSRVDAIDIYDRVYVSERRNGELALYDEAREQPIAVAQLPTGPLGQLRTALVSPDLHMLALSTDERGAVWDLARNERALYVRGFRGIHFAPDAIYANFPPERFPLPAPGEKPLTPEERRKKGNVVAKLDLRANKVAAAREYTGDTTVRQAGPYLLLTPREPDQDDKDDKPQKLRTTKLEVADATTLNVLWSKEMERLPVVSAVPEQPGLLVLIFHLNDDGAKDAIRSDPELKRTVERIQVRERSYLVQVVDALTGNAVANIPVDTGEGSFRLVDGIAGANYVVLTDSENRVLVYTRDGERIGQFFGSRPLVSRDGRLICLEREPGRLALYELPRLRSAGQLTFGTRVSYAAFAQDSQRLLVLTDDQNVFVLDVAPTKAPGGV